MRTLFYSIVERSTRNGPSGVGTGRLEKRAEESRGQEEVRSSEGGWISASVGKSLLIGEIGLVLQLFSLFNRLQAVFNCLDFFRQWHLCAETPPSGCGKAAPVEGRRPQAALRLFYCISNAINLIVAFMFFPSPASPSPSRSHFCLKRWRATLELCLHRQQLLRHQCIYCASILLPLSAFIVDVVEALGDFPDEFVREGEQIWHFRGVNSANRRQLKLVRAL